MKKKEKNEFIVSIWSADDGHVGDVASNWARNTLLWWSLTWRTFEWNGTRMRHCLTHIPNDTYFCPHVIQRIIPGRGWGRDERERENMKTFSFLSLKAKQIFFFVFVFVINCFETFRILNDDANEWVFILASVYCIVYTAAQRTILWQPCESQTHSGYQRENTFKRINKAPAPPASASREKSKQKQWSQFILHIRLYVIVAVHFRPARLPHLLLHHIQQLHLIGRFFFLLQFLLLRLPCDVRHPVSFSVFLLFCLCSHFECIFQYLSISLSTSVCVWSVSSTQHLNVHKQTPNDCHRQIPFSIKLVLYRTHTVELSYSTRPP